MGVCYFPWKWLDCGRTTSFVFWKSMFGPVNLVIRVQELVSVEMEATYVRLREIIKTTWLQLKKRDPK
uniref:Ovule protein n=1 Tax=Heterorhabditis bacteriophora TaxID=37862 RepID=A0A1I7XKD0_HETBA